MQKFLLIKKKMNCALEIYPPAGEPLVLVDLFFLLKKPHFEMIIKNKILSSF